MGGQIPQWRVSDYGIVVLLGLACAFMLVLLAFDAPYELTRNFVITLGLASVATSLRFPRVAGGALLLVFLVLAYEPSTRNVFTAMSALFVVGAIAYVGKILVAIVHGMVFVYLGSADVLQGEFVPSSAEPALLLFTIFSGALLGGAYLGAAKRKELKERRRAELAAGLERDALIAALHDSVARTLTSSIMRLEGVRRNLNLSEQEEKDLSLAAEDSRNAIGQVRDLLRVLHDESAPQLPVESPLAEQVDYFTQLLESHGFEVAIDKDERISRRQYERDLVSLPIMAELATNVLKYGNPEADVSVEIRREGKGTMIVVNNLIADVVIPNYYSTGLGLAKIQKEVEKAGGSFKSAADGRVWRTNWFVPGK